MSDEEKRKIGIRSILAWIFGVLFILVGAGSLTGSIIGGILIIVGALLILPPFGNFIEKRFNIALTGWLKFVGFIVLIGVGFSLLPPTPTEEVTETVAPTTPAPTTTVALTTTPPPTTEPPLDILDISYYEFNSMFGMEGTLTDIQKEDVFENEYKGKYVQWKCELVDLTESFGTYLMQMKCDPRTFTADMYVTLRKDQEEKAITLNKGERIEFVARLTNYGELLGHKADEGVIVD